MTLTPPPRLRITWLCSSDKGGGIVSVAEGCCMEASLAGHDVTLLLAIAPTGHVSDYGGARLTSLDAKPPYADVPARLAAWVEDNPQDILILNGCDEVDVAIPYLPAGLRVVYAVHDTAETYFRTALSFEAYLDGIIAVSETVATRFRSRLSNPHKLHVVHNGTWFPTPLDDTVRRPRSNDLMFVGGDAAFKGAQDVLALWPRLVALGFSGRLHWFGAMGEAIRKQIAELPSSGQIVLYGRRPRQEIFDIAGQSKVLLMLSRTEPFGMVTVECAGMGCLVVAWDIDTGTKEIIRAFEGAFASLGDYSALAHGVKRAVEMHNRSFEVSTARIRREFNATAMWTRYTEAFDLILASPPVARARAGQKPPPYRPPIRIFQLLPTKLRVAIRAVLGRSPRLAHALRHFRAK